jgi:AraC-like DNA-binding protein
MKIQIKNMVCARCKMVVKNELESLGFQTRHVDLGIVDLEEELNKSDRKRISTHLDNFGFELIDDKKSATIERVKNLIIELVHTKDGALKINLSDYISQQLEQEYQGVSALFSEVENTTIEKYFILQKTERVKELIVYDELSFSEIAFLLNYSSVAHLSTQFKKVTGFTPSYYKKLKDKNRNQIENL